MLVRFVLNIFWKHPLTAYIYVITYWSKQKRPNKSAKLIVIILLWGPGDGAKENFEMVKFEQVIDHFGSFTEAEWGQHCNHHTCF